MKGRERLSSSLLLNDLFFLCSLFSAPQARSVAGTPARFLTRRPSLPSSLLAFLNRLPFLS
jgi:hypothetical protein